MKVSSLFVKYVMKDSQRFLAGGVTGNEAKQVGNNSGWHGYFGWNTHHYH